MEGYIRYLMADSRTFKVCIIRKLHEIIRQSYNDCRKALLLHIKYVIKGHTL